MNFHGSKKYEKLMEELDVQVFSHCDLSTPTDVKKLDEDYYVNRYYYADIEHKKPGWAPVDGEICRLYRNDKFIFEWKNIDAHSRMITIINHSDGNKYLLFDEDLYGYSVLNLETLQCVHYIPEESYREDDIEETFIWCIPHYDKDSDLIAVEGCMWASPYSVIVLDFSHPMNIVKASEWYDLWQEREPFDYDEYVGDLDLNFVSWEIDTLRCTDLVLDKKVLKEKLVKLRGNEND